MPSTYLSLPPVSWRNPVPTASALPLTGNQPGDAIVTQDTDVIYLWTGSHWMAVTNGGVPGTITSVTATHPLSSTGGTTPNISETQANTTTDGWLSSTDWNIFNNKLDSSFGNYITNPDAEIDTSGWNLYNNSGRTVPASLTNQDLTYTSALSGSGGNGVDIEYVYNASFPAATPNINVISPTHVQVQWNNGPTIASNPTATQLKAAWDAVPAALAVATVAITGTSTKLQFINGQQFMSGGGDASPTTGAGGIVTGVTFTRNTTTPLAGTASFDLGKDAANRQGEGVSTDFSINAVDEGKVLQISFAYESSSGMVLGTNSDVQVFVYDITNAVLRPVTPLRTLPGPVSTIKEFVGVFTSAAVGVTYRLILHIATTSSTAWDLLLDDVTVNDEVTAGAPTQVPSLVLTGQPISGAVTDHMVVMWTDGASQWVPATISGVALGSDSSERTQAGFATNIVGSTADIFIQGAMGGFSFGPFVGFNQYIDNTAGNISPLPSPFTDLFVVVGTAISSTVLNIQFQPHLDMISNSVGAPLKGGLLTSSAINDGTGDLVLSVGGNGNVLVANSAASLGLQWAPAVVAGTGVVYTTATRTLTLSNLAGDVTGAPQTNTIAAATVTGKALTGFVSGAGVVTAADTILTAFNKTNGNVLLKAPIATPVFTGDVTSSTGNVLISTIGKGLQVKTGAGAKIGTAVLAAGTVTVANTSVTANSRIFVTSNADGGTVGFLRVTARTAGTSFVITSSSPLDTSTVAWMIVESIP